MRPDPISEAYNMDCMEYMRQFPDKWFELAVVDPPYGIDIAKKPISMGRWKRKIHSSKEWDSGIPNKNYFNELKRISKNQIIWGGNYFIEFLNSTRCMIVWDKNNGTNMMADCELAWTSFNSSVRKFTRSHINDYNEGIDRFHPTQKPVALYRWILQNYAKEGDKILDTHLGSGSSRIAAWDLGFDFYSTELDKEYFELQQERFRKHSMQQRLF